MADDEITRLLNQWLAGDISAEEDLFRLVHGELRRRARKYMANENAGHSLGPTDLVHQAYVKLDSWQRKRQGKPLQSRGHFYAIFSRAMRQTLVDHARAKHTQKRGGGAERVSLEEADKYYQTLLDLDSLLESLASDNLDASRVFEHKHFGGLTLDEIAEATGMDKKKVSGSLQYAKLWLQRALKSKNDEENSTK